MLRWAGRNRYTVPMSDRAYVNFWTREPSEALMLDRFERLLETVPLSPEQPGFTGVLVRAVGPAETPLVELDLRNGVYGHADVVALARQYLHADTQYEVAAYWDLWRYQPENGGWKRGPEPLLLICRGEAYDDSVAAQEGDLVTDLGFEHLFTGSPVLTSQEAVRAPADPLAAMPVDTLEAQHSALLAEQQYRQEYRDKIRQNVEQLFQWVRAVEKALPVERYQLWSEGEDNLEARLDDILAAH